jgi:hypothetical protein
MSEVSFSRRTRCVSIRLSEEEYQSLLLRCESDSAHSVSAYARAALFESRAPAAGGEEMRRILLSLEHGIRNLGGEVKMLREQMRSRAASPGQAQDGWPEQ